MDPQGARALLGGGEVPARHQWWTPGPPGGPQFSAPDRLQRLVIGKGVADGHVRRFEARLSVFGEPLTRFARFFHPNSPKNRQKIFNGQANTDNGASERRT